MADLDDFFKKKDSKKGKIKKFSSIDPQSLAVDLEEEKKKKKIPPKPTQLVVSKNESEEDIIWKENEESEPEEDIIKDLKIKNLQLDNPEKNETYEEVTQKGDDGKDVVVKKKIDKETKPWKGANQNQKIDIPAEVKKPEPEVAVKQAYVPPRLKEELRSIKATSKKFDVTSEELFPTLGSKPPSKKSVSSKPSQTKKTPPLEPVKTDKYIIPAAKMQGSGFAWKS